MNLRYVRNLQNHVSMTITALVVSQPMNSEANAATMPANSEPGTNEINTNENVENVTIERVEHVCEGFLLVSFTLVKFLVVSLGFLFFLGFSCFL